ncbi:hypothetical protein BDV12DRAFT_206664 [Aspergillus spectabilis]
MSALQLHARVFALADKYDVKDFNVVEFLESIPDVYHLTAPQDQTLRDSIYDEITREVPTFTKDLLDSYIASPILADCHNCGPTMAMQALQVRCRKCSRGRAY